MKRSIEVKLQSALKSYDINAIDFKGGKELVIQQVLNRGDWELIHWLFQKYSEAQIKRVVAYPRRGRWYPRVLNLWQKIYQIRLPNITKERAYIRMDCRPDLFPASYFRKRKRRR